MLNGLIILLLFFLGGEFISELMGWPVPGSVLGMFMLFLFLSIRGALDENLKKTSNALLPYLPLFIVPASVGIVNHLELLREDGLLIMVAMVVSLIIGIPVGGWVMTLCMEKKAKQTVMNQRKGNHDA